MASLPAAEFVRIGQRTSLYTPEKQANGQLIIICTWLGAAPKHISKYVSLYQRIAPRARILLIESAVPILISSYRHQRSVIQPAVSAVLDSLSESGISPADPSTDTTSLRDQSPKILLHTFSNGGTNTATQLLIELRKRLDSSLPLAGVIFDSCPAKGTYWKSYDAMLLSLPKDPMSRSLGAVACHCILILLYTWIACGNENPASLQRRTLVDENTVDGRQQATAEDNPSSSVEGRACYIYSSSDKMCDWNDVTDHAKYVEAKGWQVKEVMVEGSGHCAHLTKDEATYASAVEEMWDAAIDVRDDKISAKI